MTESTFQGVDGLRIFTRSWRPETPPRAVVVIMHGFNSHSGQYTWTAEQFVARGLAVYALDMRGRGRSEGDRFFVEKIDHYVQDLATLIAAAKAAEPGLPVFLLGHSAGGVVSCLYALEHQAGLAGLVCESFAHEVPAPAFAQSGKPLTIGRFDVVGNVLAIGDIAQRQAAGACQGQQVAKTGCFIKLRDEHRRRADCGETLGCFRQALGASHAA